MPDYRRFNEKNCKEYERKQHWANLKHYTHNSLVGHNKTTKTQSG
jgi:hypothetical protein